MTTALSCAAGALQATVCVRSTNHVLTQLKTRDDSGSILRYSDAWRLMPALEKLAAQDERLEDKSQYDAFLNTALEERLRGKGVKTVVITGTLTNLCCETTAREAFCRDFDVVVLDDGCAAASDRHHRASLENLEFGFADVWTISDLVTRLKAKPSS
ncbi:Isochorismatase hydrolase [Heliocybe sulcata]|uniref:Isochorismatase hydrolase n=1 Tax=Heliocybe sulcata TaxID=5364 RepID=A0A5C3N8S7_9AGAM|nr:Isochorismatase hydrolase [Heliocybe sulcata]